MKTNHYNPFNSRNFIPIDSDLRNLNLSIPPDTENVQNQSTGSGSWAAALNFILKICGSHSRLIWRHISDRVCSYIEMHDLGIDRVTDIA